VENISIKTRKILKNFVTIILQSLGKTAYYRKRKYFKSWFENTRKLNNSDFLKNVVLIQKSFRKFKTSLNREKSQTIILKLIKLRHIKQHSIIYVNFKH
jgi:hypothetical protein